MKITFKPTKEDNCIYVENLTCEHIIVAHGKNLQSFVLTCNQTKNQFYWKRSDVYTNVKLPITNLFWNIKSAIYLLKNIYSDYDFDAY